MYRARLVVNGVNTEKRFNTIEEKNKYIESVYNNSGDLDENWSRLKNFTRYEYSNKGNLRSVNYKNTGCKKVLSPAKNKDGYLKTVLQDENGKYKTISVHIVIMNSEIEKPSNLHEVNHKDGNKENNAPNNLEWLTHSENCKHSFDTGLQQPKKGELNGMSKLSQKQVDFLRNEKKTKGRFWGRNEYAKKLGMSPKHLQKIVNSDTSWK